VVYDAWKKEREEMNFNPKQRYSAVAVFSDDLERVVLIHKQKPAWQAGKANMPGGKVETTDAAAAMDLHVPFPMSQPWPQETFYALHRVCASRELREETGLDIAATALQLFCRLRFVSCEGDAAECCFYAARGDVDAARTMESERVFVEEIENVLCGDSYHETYRSAGDAVFKTSDIQTVECPFLGEDMHVPTMPNLPYLVAMARQCLRGEGAGLWPLTVYESGAAS
jgi:8-oxo-dGTP pyrophosphatase MutT (NUDIX family)